MQTEYRKNGTLTYDEECVSVEWAGRDRTPLSVKQNRNKGCSHNGCNNKRGDRGLYCSAECHRIDSN
jgi:hypothetical protein